MMFEYILLGAIQGIAEWLPVSSSGIIVLVQANFLELPASFSENLEFLLYLHFGTFLAALVYFRREVLDILRTAVRYRTSGTPSRKALVFFAITTAISGAMGLVILYVLNAYFPDTPPSARTINGAVGALLLVTALSQFIRRNDRGTKTEKDLVTGDGVFLGFMQGVSLIPGISRSGLTIAGLFLRDFEKVVSLRLSFIMSLPVVFAGTLVTGFDRLVLETDLFIAAVSSFVFGLATIHILLKAAHRINFGYFVLIFAVILIAAAFLPTGS